MYIDIIPNRVHCYNLYYLIFNMNKYMLYLMKDRYVYCTFIYIHIYIERYKCYKLLVQDTFSSQ